MKTRPSRLEVKALIDEAAKSSLIKVASFSLLFLLGVLPVVNWLAFGPHVPEGTFFLIGQLDQVTTDSDPSNIAYSFARPPIYFLLGWLYDQPWSFLIAGFLAHAAFNFAVFAIAYMGLSRTRAELATGSAITIAVLIAALAYPVAVLAGVAGHGTSLLPHDGYQNFSFRTIFAVLTAISYLCVLNGKPAAGLVVAGVSCYVHPTAGFILLGLLTLALVPIAVYKQQYPVLVVWVAAIIFGATPVFIKIIFFELPTTLSESLSYGSWYSMLIKNEADDFSILYQFLVYPLHTARLIGLIFLPLFVYSRLFPGYASHRSFWFAAAIPCLFLAGAAIELFFAAIMPTPLVYLFSALTPGYRFLSFSFFPLIVIISRILHHFLLRISGPWSLDQPRTSLAPASVLFIVFISLALMATGLSKGRFASSVQYSKWAWQAGEVSGIDYYLAAANLGGTNLYYGPDLRIASGAVVTYPKERNIFKIRMADLSQPPSIPDVDAMSRLSLAEFLQLIPEIRTMIPAGSGLIIPPYMRYFRDALPDYPIFFQEHHDGNIMLGSPAFTKFWTDRMTDLLGFNYEGMPSKYSGLFDTFMRRAFLALEETGLGEIHEKYPEYPYLVTEIDHALRYAIVIKTGSFVVYDLRLAE